MTDRLEWLFGRPKGEMLEVGPRLLFAVIGTVLAFITERYARLTTAGHWLFAYGYVHNSILFLLGYVWLFAIAGFASGWAIGASIGRKASRSFQLASCRALEIGLLVLSTLVVSYCVQALALGRPPWFYYLAGVVVFSICGLGLIKPLADMARSFLARGHGS